jgi:hypothetical protein
VLFLVRQAFLLPFVSRPTDWFDAEIDVDGLGEVRMPKYWRDQGYSTLADLAVRNKDMTIAGFDPAKVRGRPIVVSIDGDAPLYLIEGGHRCSEVFRLRRAGNYLGSLNVILGVCPRAREMVQIG